MQDAYFQEKGQVGNWQNIGYSAPGEKKNTYSYASNVFGFSGEETCGNGTACTWTAKPKTKLNDCTTAMQWQLSAVEYGTAVDNVWPNFKITEGTTNSECKVLTASWESLQGSH